MNNRFKKSKNIYLILKTLCKIKILLCRLENNNKKNLIELSEGINEMLININKKFNLTNAEFKSLKTTIRSRVGSGFIYAKKFSLLPEPIFSVVYYALSPLLLTKLKAILSHVNNKQKELLYRFYS